MMHERIVKDFLTLRLEKGGNLLLALSGGPDSIALFHFLIEAKKSIDFSLHIAHVDHGWREESGKEAEALRQLASFYKLPFFLHRLEPMEGGDLENRCRKERLAFFSRLHQEHHYQALLLAHHSGDQAETVFKRVAEGAGLRGLGGLYAERSIGNIPIWRPLLKVKKEELIAYLQRKKLHYFEDSTNRDSRYLRARMREKLFPTLEKIFGKKMEKNFSRLGEMCQELAEYFDAKGAAIESHLVYGPFGAYLPLHEDLSLLELKYFLKTMAPFSYDALEVLAKLIERRRSSRLVHAGELTFQVTRSHLFIYKRPFPSFFETPSLWSCGEEAGWEAFWQGKLPMQEGVELKSLSELEPLLRKKLKKWYASHHVPSFFYDKAPVFLQKGELIGECLTGLSVHDSFCRVRGKAGQN